MKKIRTTIEEEWFFLNQQKENPLISKNLLHIYMSTRGYMSLENAYGSIHNNISPYINYDFQKNQNVGSLAFSTINYTNSNWLNKVIQAPFYAAENLALVQENVINTDKMEYNVSRSMQMSSNASLQGFEVDLYRSKTVDYNLNDNFSLGYGPGFKIGSSGVLSQNLSGITLGGTVGPTLSASYHSDNEKLYANAQLYNGIGMRLDGFNNTPPFSYQAINLVGETNLTTRALAKLGEKLTLGAYASTNLDYGNEAMSANRAFLNQATPRLNTEVGFIANIKIR